jgi:hypothetical protein
MIAAHQRRRSGIAFSDGVAVGANSARSMSVEDLSSMPIEPSRGEFAGFMIQF